MEVKESLNFSLIPPEMIPSHTSSSSVVSCLPSIDCQRKATCDLITNSNNILQTRTSEAANNFVIEVYNLDKVKSRPRDRGKSIVLPQFACFFPLVFSLSDNLRNNCQIFTRGKKLCYVS